MSLLKKFIGTSDFTKNLVTLISGTGLAQIILVATSPLISRLFSPEDFAPFALFMAFIAILSSVATGRYEMAILLPKKIEDTKSLMALSMILAFISSLFILVGVFVYDVWLYRYWPSENFNATFYLLAPTVFVMGAYKAMNYWSTKHKTYKKNALGRILIAAVVAGLSIVAGWMHFTAGLIIAYFIGQLAGLLALSGDVIKQRKNFFSGVTKPGMKAMLQKHISFPKVNMPHALVDNLQENGVIFFIAYFFTDALVGLYGYAVRILKAPVGLIGDAFYQVFYQDITQNNYPAAEIKRKVRKTFFKTFMVGIVPFTILFFFGASIFAFVFGEEWRGAGELVQILTPWMFLHFMTSPVSCIPLVFNKQNESFLLACIHVVLKYTLLIIAGFYRDADLAFILMSIFGSVYMILVMFWYLHIIRDELRQDDNPSIEEPPLKAYETIV